MNGSNETDGAWNHIELLLDEVMVKLSARDCTAALLRFFERKSFRVGLALGLSEDTAQKRVIRAVKHLRAFFAKMRFALPR
ncbi:MAG: hypothetical protein M2R45_02345 [Verrucomicrobia subdivision 3 bacterium]|nr:hypothetical protein [Limisphaerales bacterium]MCS1414897.1 hypothetical protein [Limisphaerales bacterium]